MHTYMENVTVIGKVEMTLPQKEQLPFTLGYRVRSYYKSFGPTRGSIERIDDHIQYNNIYMVLKQSHHVPTGRFYILAMN